MFGDFTLSQQHKPKTTHLPGRHSDLVHSVKREKKNIQNIEMFLDLVWHSHDVWRTVCVCVCVCVCVGGGYLLAGDDLKPSWLPALVFAQQYRSESADSSRVESRSAGASQPLCSTKTRCSVAAQSLTASQTHQEAQDGTSAAEYVCTFCQE